MINSTLNHVALLMSPPTAPPTQRWACVMVQYITKSCFGVVYNIGLGGGGGGGGRRRQSLFCQCSKTLWYWLEWSQGFCPRLQPRYICTNVHLRSWIDSKSVNSITVFWWQISEFKLHVFGNGKRHAGSNFRGKIFVERFRFIFSFLCRKNNHALQF
jgi:hypothetical protein